MTAPGAGKDVMLSTEQKEARKGKITSSVAAAVLGVDEHASPIDAWLEIRGEGPSDEEMSDEMRRACDRGNRLEGLTLDYAAEVRGLQRHPAPFMRHPDYDWLGDSADAIYTKPGRPIEPPYWLGEAKTVGLGGSHLYVTEGTDQVPMHALVQSHHHLVHRPDAESCLIPVCLGGYAFEFRLYEVRRDPEWERMMIDKLGEWHHRYIVGDTMPPATHRDTAWLTRRFAGRTDDMPLESTPEIEHWAQGKALASARLKQADEEEKHAKNQLRALLGDYTITEADWGNVTWRRNKPSLVIDHEAIANLLLGNLEPAEAEKIIAAYTREKPGDRVLRVNLSKALKRELGL